MATIIAISGGIGSGKSVVSRILRLWNYPVFDCDSEAKRLMDNDDSIKALIARDICTDAIIDNNIDRKRLADVVFNDAAKLQRLNEIVHTSVRNLLRSWTSNIVTQYAFVETAILRSSGLENDVDAEWFVDAPKDIRIQRVIKRNGISAAEVNARMDSQKHDEQPSHIIPVTTIINDGNTPLLPQLQKALFS